MNLLRAKLFLFVFILLLSACAKQTPSALPTATLVPTLESNGAPTETPTTVPIETPTGPPTEIATDVPTEVLTKAPSNTDPSLFGSISKSEINPLAARVYEIIFIKVMDGYIASGNIIEYQITFSELFPSSDGKPIADIMYNVRTTDTSWLVDGGTPAEDNWITNKCNRFDFVNTETEFQLKNRRTCN